LEWEDLHRFKTPVMKFKCAMASLKQQGYVGWIGGREGVGKGISIWGFMSLLKFTQSFPFMTGDPISQ